MRLLMLLLVFLAGYTAAGAAQETDDAALEINPFDYLPLEVGNRWTYEHVYQNYLYEAGYPFDIPGYPSGDPPDSLKSAEKIVTIEITHTEVIDGLEYFVFSDADYAWPPLPGFFWGGKKVRLSDEGFLVFRWNGQELPVYDFGPTSNPYAYTRTLPRGSGTVEVRFNRSYGPYRLSRVFFRLSDTPYHEAGIAFLQDYGVGIIYIEVYGLGACGATVFRNELVPISATISGEEIAYEQVRSFYQSFKSTELGQAGQVRIDEGFDFSKGTHSEPSNDFELVSHSPFSSYGSGKLACFYLPVFETLSSETGIADLGEIDFSLLIAEGIPPDLRLDFVTSHPPAEGHTYAVRSREGGVALLYVFDVGYTVREEYRPIAYEALWKHVTDIKFDWVYYPDGLPDSGTSVQPTSWGQLKQRFLQDSPSKQE